MAGIQYNFATNNDNLPIEQNLFDAVKAIAGRKAWFQPEVDAVTLTGANINSFIDVGGNGAVMNPNTTARARLKADAVNNQSSVEFYWDGVFNVYTGANFTFDWGQSWTEFVVYKTVAASAGSDYKTIVGPTGATAIRALLTQQRDNPILSLLYGSTGSLVMPSAHGLWHAAIVSFHRDAANPTTASFVRAWIDGVNVAPVMVAPVANTTLPRIGDIVTGTQSQPLNGQIADLAFFQADLFEHPEALALLKQYAANVYEIS